jgi:hypothetical protein
LFPIRHLHVPLALSVALLSLFSFFSHSHPISLYFNLEFMVSLTHRDAISVIYHTRTSGAVHLVIPLPAPLHRCCYQARL